MILLVGHADDDLLTTHVAVGVVEEGVEMDASHLTEGFPVEGGSLLEDTFERLVDLGLAKIPTVWRSGVHGPPRGRGRGCTRCWEWCRRRVGRLSR